MIKNKSNFGLNWLKHIKKSYIQMIIVYILFTEKNCTGYIITESLRSRLGSLFTISAGTVYPQLNKLVEDGILHSETKIVNSAFVRPNEPRKVYQLTKYGLSIVNELQDYWFELIALTNTFLEDVKTTSEES